MKKFLHLYVIAPSLSVMFVAGFLMFSAHHARAVSLVDGDLIKTADHADIFIAKFIGVKKFKRLILNPDIFNQYGHLRWDDVEIVDNKTINSFTTTNTVRWVEDEKVYLLSPNGDVGTKHWLNMTPAQFEQAGYDWDAIYLINEHEYNSYAEGNPIAVGYGTISYAPFSYGLIADVSLFGQLEKLAELNVDITRLEPGIINGLPTLKDAIRSYGIEMLVINVDQKWPPGSPGIPPPYDFASWAQVLKYTVQRHPDVIYWQVWNEPNEVLYWYPQPNAAEYTELLKKSYIAIKEANPNAKVLNGGLSGINPALRQFLRDMYANGAGNYFDILALHPYGQPNSPDTYLRDFLYDIKNIMDANGDVGKPIWITEIGWPTDPSQFGYVSQAQQAEFLQKTYDIARAINFVERVIWYRLYDPAEGMGIADKPAEQVYKNLKL